MTTCLTSAPRARAGKVAASAVCACSFALFPFLSFLSSALCYLFFLSFLRAICWYFPATPTGMLPASGTATASAQHASQTHERHRTHRRQPPAYPPPNAQMQPCKATPHFFPAHPQAPQSTVSTPLQMLPPQARIQAEIQIQMQAFYYQLYHQPHFEQIRLAQEAHGRELAWFDPTSEQELADELAKILHLPTQAKQPAQDSSRRSTSANTSAVQEPKPAKKSKNRPRRYRRVNVEDDLMGEVLSARMAAISATAGSGDRSARSSLDPREDGTPAVSCSTDGLHFDDEDGDDEDPRMRELQASVLSDILDVM
jgi:hypothetical protein